MRTPMLDPDLSVDEIMRRWPATIKVVISNGMLCVGCPIGPFHTVAEASAAHRLDAHAVTDALLAAISGGGSRQSASTDAHRSRPPSGVRR
jgi:hybrid cluster-associated redox disulfide protein